MLASSLFTLNKFLGKENKNMKEIWKDIEGYEGDYQVSNLGRIKSFKNKKEIIMKPGATRGGYLGIILRKNKKSKPFKVHRLVAMAFIPNPNNYPEVNHKDENKTNNCADKLEWCTKHYNLFYGDRLNKERTERILIEVEKEKVPVCQYDLNGNFIKTFNSIRDAAREIGKGKDISSGIVRCCKGISAHCYKFVWRYKEDDFDKFNIKDRDRKKVSQYTKNGEYLRTWSSITLASKQTGIDKSTIIRNCKMRQKTAGGYIWKYEAD